MDENFSGATGPVGRKAMRLRRVISAVCVSGMLLQMACYASVPVETSATAMSGVYTVTVNDRGRLLVGAKLGSLLDRVDGRITGSDANSVQIVVATAYDVRGASTNWGGEPVTIPREGIATITQRRVEKGSTILVLAGVAVALVAIYTGLHHLTQTSGADDPGGPSSGGLLSVGRP